MEWTLISSTLYVDLDGSLQHENWRNGKHGSVEEHETQTDRRIRNWHRNTI